MLSTKNFLLLRKNHASFPQNLLYSRDGVLGTNSKVVSTVLAFNLNDLLELLGVSNHKLKFARARALSVLVTVLSMAVSRVTRT